MPDLLLSTSIMRKRLFGDYDKMSFSDAPQQQLPRRPLYNFMEQQQQSAAPRQFPKPE